MSSTPEVPVESSLNNEALKIAHKAKIIFSSICDVPGGYAHRLLDTWIKDKPTIRDLTNTNKVISELKSQEATLPAANPFKLLWMVNCLVYFVFAAFLLLKGWKKEINPSRTSRRSEKEKYKRIYLEKVCQTRKQISVTKTELEKIEENRKLTKRGEKNRRLLEKECKIISAVSLINFMEKKKSALRKLKKVFCQQKKQEELRKVNRRFQCDPGQIYSELDEMAKSNSRDGLPTFKLIHQDNVDNEKCQFNDIDEASSFG